MLVRDSITFSRAHARKNRVIGWRCYIRSCSTKIYINVSGELIINKTGEHKHGKCLNIRRKAFGTSLKKKQLKILVKNT